MKAWKIHRRNDRYGEPIGELWAEPNEPRAEPSEEPRAEPSGEPRLTSHPGSCLGSRPPAIRPATCPIHIIVIFIVLLNRKLKFSLHWFKLQVAQNQPSKNQSLLIEITYKYIYIYNLFIEKYTYSCVLTFCTPPLTTEFWVQRWPHVLPWESWFSSVQWQTDLPKLSLPDRTSTSVSTKKMGIWLRLSCEKKPILTCSEDQEHWCFSYIATV